MANRKTKTRKAKVEDYSTDEKVKARRLFFVIFIFLGLILCLSGIYFYLCDRHYDGEIENFEIEAKITNSRTVMLVDEFLWSIWNVGPTLYYKFIYRSFKAIEGLSYTLDTKLLWYTVAGLPFLALGICAITRKDFLFK